jgi:hypothetical protein
VYPAIRGEVRNVPKHPPKFIRKRNRCFFAARYRNQPSGPDPGDHTFHSRLVGALFEGLQKQRKAIQKSGLIAEIRHIDIYAEPSGLKTPISLKAHLSHFSPSFQTHSSYKNTVSTKSYRYFCTAKSQNRQG